MALPAKSGATIVKIVMDTLGVAPMDKGNFLNFNPLQFVAALVVSFVSFFFLNSLFICYNAAGLALSSTVCTIMFITKKPHEIYFENAKGHSVELITDLICGYMWLVASPLVALSPNGAVWLNGFIISKITL